MGVLALLAIVLIAIWMQQLLFNRMAFKKLDYKCEFSVNQAYEGDSIFLVEIVHNRKLLPVPWLKVNIHTSRWLDYAGTKSAVAQENRHVTSSFFLRSYQKITRRWKLKCLKRGVYTIQNVTLVSGDLLGYSTSSIPVSVDASLTVYPEILNIEDMLVPMSHVQGDTIVKRWIIDDPFMVAGAREYTPRDPMNRIHWHATARAGRLMVKNNDFTSHLSTTVVLNIQSLEYEYFGVVHRDLIELGIKAAATVLDRALRNGIPVRLATNGSTIDGNRKMIFTAEASGWQHVDELLRILAKLELKRIEDFEVFLEGISPNIENSHVILITSYINEGICSLARSLKTQNNHISIILLDSTQSGSIPGDIDFYFLSGVDK